ncbi:MAG: hypothetical protein ACI33P_12715 [Lysinibacillus sp.]
MEMPGLYNEINLPTALIGFDNRATKEGALLLSSSTRKQLGILSPLVMPDGVIHIRLNYK